VVKHVGVAELKAQLSEILREIERTGGRVVIERRGRPVAVIQPHDPRVAEEPAHWAAALDGVAADIDDFQQVIDSVIASRDESGSRSVDLDE
jgi:prevent-host-death family protein